MKKIKSSKLSLKLLIYIICVTIVILVLVAFIFFFLYRNQMKERYRRATYNTLSNVDVVFDGYINNARNMAIQFHQSPGGVQCRYSTEYKLGMHVEFVKNILDTISYTPYIQSVLFVNSQKKVSLFVNSGISYIAEYEKQLVEKISSLEGEWVHAWLAPNRYVPEEYVPMLSCLYSDTPGYNGTTAVNIDMRVLSKNLFASRTESEMTIFIVDKHGNIIAHSDAAYCGENWESSKILQNITAGNNQFNIAMESDNYEVNWISSRQDDFIVVAQTRFDSVGDEAVILWILFAAFVLLTSFVYLIIRKILNPLIDVVLDISDIGVLDEKSYDEVDLLRKYHINMCERIELLNRQMYKNLFVKNLIVGAGKEVVWSMLDEMNPVKSAKGHFLVLAYLLEKPEKKEELPDYMEAKDRIYEACGYSLAEAGGLEYFDVSFRRVMFLLSELEDKELELEFLEELLAKKKQELDFFLKDFTVVLVLSQKIEKDKDVCQIYRDMNGCLQTRLLLEEVESVSFADKDRTVGIADNRIKAISRAVIRREHERYRSEVEKLLHECRNIPYERFCDVLMECWYVINDINESSDKKKSSLQDNMWKHILSLRTRRALLEWFEGLYVKKEEYITRISEHSSAETLMDIVEYIQNNYGEYNLNVSFLADQMNLSVQHFSRVFKEFTGETVLEYITKVRMEKARDLLTVCPDMDMIEIAESLGYGNGAYFAKVFKKYYGMSPAKYRDYHVVLKFKKDNLLGNTEDIET